MTLQEEVERHEQQLQQERVARQAEHTVRRTEIATYRRLTDAMDGKAILYPHTEGGFPVCFWCFQRTPDLAHCADPRDGELRLQCMGCYRALVNDRPLPLPTGDALTGTWYRIARLHQNEEIDDGAAARALEMLAPHLSREDGWAALAGLQHELLELQAAEEPGAVLDGAATGPDDDPETYINNLRGLVDGAVHALIGSAA